MMPHGSPGVSLPQTHVRTLAYPKPDRADWSAISILHSAMVRVDADVSPVWPYNKKQALRWLLHAVGHLSHPDRAVYPKTRRGTKGDPVVRSRQ